MITRLEQKQLPIPHTVLHSTLQVCAAAKVCLCYSTQWQNRDAASALNHWPNLYFYRAFDFSKAYRSTLWFKWYKNKLTWLKVTNVVILFLVLRCTLWFQFASGEWFCPVVCWNPFQMQPVRNHLEWYYQPIFKWCLFKSYSLNLWLRMCLATVSGLTQTENVL